MRKREKDSIVGKISRTPEAKHGSSVHVRPYYSDEKKLDEIARETGEGKAAVVRRMIHFALSDKPHVFVTNRCQDKLDWLIKTERQKDADFEVLGERLDSLSEKTASIENDIETVAGISHQASILLRELYCMSSVSISSLNHIFTKLLEFSSPDATEREHSISIANGAMANLIAHAIRDLHKCSDFHGIQAETEIDAPIYIGSKIKVLNERIDGSVSKTCDEGERRAK